MNLFTAVYGFCSQYGYEKTYWVAYSGGLDSHVLLDLCHKIRDLAPLDLRAIHINHGLSPNADTWAAHCARICKQYAIEYSEKKIQLEKNMGASLEEIARDERYAVFEKMIKTGDILLTAHQQDDQAETVLLQLLRGAGLKGLAAMPQMRLFGPGLHGRPLLFFSRNELEDYAQKYNLQWINDESNLNKELSRNFIRHDILPLLKTRWPSATAAISRSAIHCAEAESLLAESSLDILKKVEGSELHTLSVKKLLLLNSQKQKLALRTWIQNRGHLLPSTKKLETIKQNVLLAAQDKMPCVRWANSEIRRFRGLLYLNTVSLEHDAHKSYEWDLTQPLNIPALGSLHATEKLGNGLNKNIERVLIRFRRGGEVANLLARGRHTLKNLFQEWNIPPWERDRIPLVFINDKLIAAVGYFIDPDFAAKQFEMGYELKLER